MTRSEFDAEFPEYHVDYHELHGGVLCGSCAAAETSSNIDAGGAIGMMNGD